MNVSQLFCENAAQISRIFLKSFGPIGQTALELGLRTFRSGPCHDRILKATENSTRQRVSRYLGIL